MRASSRAALLGAALAWGAIIFLARRGVAAPDQVLDGVTVLVASVVRTALGWIGVTVSQSAAVLYLPGGFGYVVGAGCTGIVPAAVMVVAIFASPASIAARAAGLAVAVPLVLILNVVRLVHLFYLGVYAPQSFAMAHEVLWECAMVVGTVGIWWGWWSLVREKGDGRRNYLRRRTTPFSRSMSG